jgi:hypothetical protein
MREIIVLYMSYINLTSTLLNIRLEQELILKRNRFIAPL